MPAARLARLDAEDVPGPLVMGSSWRRRVPCGGEPLRLIFLPQGVSAQNRPDRDSEVAAHLPEFWRVALTFVSFVVNE